MEEWRPINGFSSHEVSNLGNVRSVDRFVRGPNGLRHINGRVLTPTPQKRGGYLKVELAKRGATRKVHVLVCETFHGLRPSPRHHVAHWDGNIRNNSATNLRWATRAENEHDKIRHRRLPLGERHWNAKLSSEDVIKIRQHKGAHAAIATAFGISRITVIDIKSGRSWAWLK